MKRIPSDRRRVINSINSRKLSQAPAFAKDYALKSQTKSLSIDLRIKAYHPENDRNDGITPFAETSDMKDLAGNREFLHACMLNDCATASPDKHFYKVRRFFTFFSPSNILEFGNRIFS